MHQLISSPSAPYPMATEDKDATTAVPEDEDLVDYEEDVAPDTAAVEGAPAQGTEVKK